MQDPQPHINSIIRRSIIEAIIRYAVVIVLTLLLFWLDHLQLVSQLWIMLLIFFVACFKSCYFVWHSFRKIVEVTRNDVPYYEFLVFMSINVTLVIFSFGLDFFCLYEVAPYNFSGINLQAGLLHHFLDFLYFSILGFTNFGYAHIMPETMIAKYLVTIELIISFATIIFILSDFIGLKESISTSHIIRREEDKNKTGRNEL